MSVSRRDFVRQAAAVSAGFGGLQLFVLTGCTGERPGARALRSVEFGPLVPDPDGIFDLPAGFTYRVIARFGETMDDGFLVPHRPDGMAAFPGPDGTTILICNHEVDAGKEDRESAFGKDFVLAPALDASDFYDPGKDGHPAGGGTTTIVYDTVHQRRIRQFLSLAGTCTNCAGGPTPWNSWLSCEETTIRPHGPFVRDHGYVFEVPATAEPRLARPLPIKPMGRFEHEAIAIDPASGVVYETEDRADGLLYRYLPDVAGDLHAGGRLQALAVRARPGFDTRNWTASLVTPGDVLSVEWIDCDDVEAPEDDLRHRGHARGAARFARGEGMWYGNGVVYFACTEGGPAKIGQIWKYTPSPAEGTPSESAEPGTLELFIESTDPGVLENADNLTVAPWGDLFVCEDSSDGDHLVGITPAGELYRFGRNALSESELAGVTFSPDGSTLFVNLQDDGLTLAITGPWEG